MKIIINIPEDIRVAITRVGLVKIPDEMLEEVDKAIQNGTPLTECKVEDCIPRYNALLVAQNEYCRGFHDAIGKALKEEYTIHSEEGCFKVIQKETLIGIGMSKDMPIGENAEDYMDTMLSVYPKNNNSVLEDIKAEITKLYDTARGAYRDGYVPYCNGVDDVVEIIDKHISGKEINDTN